VPTLFVDNDILMLLAALTECADKTKTDPLSFHIAVGWRVRSTHKQQKMQPSSSCPAKSCNVRTANRGLAGISCFMGDSAVHGDGHLNQLWHTTQQPSVDCRSHSCNLAPCPTILGKLEWGSPWSAQAEKEKKERQKLNTQIEGLHKSESNSCR